MSLFPKTPQQTPSAISAILFDKDGTLMDFQASWGPWAQGVILEICGGPGEKAEAVALAMGFDMAQVRFHPDSAMIAGTPEDVLEVLQPHFPQLTQQQILARLDADPDRFLPMPVPGLGNICAALTQAGYALAVVTNDFEASAHDHLRQMDVSAHFSAVVGYDSGYGGKPAPGPCLGAAERLGVAPSGCVMVGDSLHDLVAGRAAGMMTVAVLTGVAQAHELAPHADVVLDSVADLFDWLCHKEI